MAEMSKTARASMGKVEKKEKVVETPEESIRQLRLNLDAGLYVTPDRIRVLLTAYDQRGEELQAYLKLGKMAQDMNTISRAWNGQDMVVSTTEIEAAQGRGPIMAEIPAQEHDEHHLVDFGHHNTHSHHEGA